jgi:hypothetical protein
MSKITSDDPTQPVGAEPTCETAHQEPGTNIDGPAIEKGHSPSPRPEEQKPPTPTPIVTALADIKTATALQSMTFEALKFIVPDLIVEGCVLLAGKPKAGKSWFVLDIGLAVACGGYCLGDKKCEQGDVLYLALEDADRRLQRHITKLLLTFGGKWPERFQYVTRKPRANEGGIEAIDQWCETHPDARLVMIDVLAKFRAPSSGKGVYQQDYALVSRLQDYWPFWRLQTPEPVDGGGPQTENVENHGRGIEKAFPGRADHCRNIERIARLPGTINHKTGERACVVECRPESAYELTDFPRVETSAEEGAAANFKSKNRVNGESSRHRPGGVDVDKLPVPETVKEMIRTGKHPHKRSKSRSEPVFAVLVAMAGEGCDDVAMTSVMLDPELPIGAHIRVQPDPGEYLERQIRRAREYVDNSTRRPAAELSYEHKQMLLGMQRKELRLLHRLRRLNLPFETWASEKGVDLGHLYDPVDLGVLVQFAVEEDDRFATDPMGRTRNGVPWKGFPKRLLPAGFTKAQTKERRKRFNRPKRTAAERRRRAENRAAKIAMVQQAADLTCRKSAILAVLPYDWTTLRKLMAGTLRKILVGSSSPRE